MVNSQSLPQELVKKIKLEFSQGKPKKQIAREFGVSIFSVRKYLNDVLRATIATGTGIGIDKQAKIGEPFGEQLPEPIARDTSIVEANEHGFWLILSDVHLPFHSKHAIELAVDYAKRYNVSGILLNGDILDCLPFSRFVKRPDSHLFEKERDYAVQFLDWLRSKFPAARIIFRQGNHEQRLEDYLSTKAPELFGIKELTFESLLGLKEKNVEFVKDKRIVRIGKLVTLHGHEYQSGLTQPVNPARGLFLRATHTALAGHGHRTSEHWQRDVLGEQLATWTVGCLCDLSPLYNPLSHWNHGFAVVELQQDRCFSVHNLKIINGKIV